MKQVPYADKERNILRTEKGACWRGIWRSRPGPLWTGQRKGGDRVRREGRGEGFIAVRC